MLESFRSTAAPRRAVLVATLVALLVLAIAQLLSYRAGGWNAGLILLASMIVANLLWRYRRRE